MKKWLCMLLCLAVLLVPFGAMAAVRMPEMRGNINDSADILSAQTTNDLADFIKQVTKRADIDLYVATVHFLDGMDVQAYTDQLFAKWELTDEDLLLVGAAGEDSFAMHMGSLVESKLGKTNVDNLLYISSEFGELFRTQRYDAAVASWCAAFNTLVEKQLGKGVRMETMFGGAEITTPEQLDEYGEALWKDIMDSINQSSHDYQDHYERAERESKGLTAGGWIVLLILISILFRKNKGDRRGCGCGCSPLGWVLSLLGLGFLFDNRPN